jgi:DNA-binding MarR family transcriptional regulator
VLRLSEYLPYRLSVAANAVSQLIARAYEDRFGLRIPEWRLIAVLAEGGPLTPQALCERTMMDKVTVTRSAQALVRRRLLERAPNPNDKRSHHLLLTRAGSRLYAGVAPLALDYETRLLHGLSTEEISGLMQLLRRVEAAAIAAFND